MDKKTLQVRFSKKEPLFVELIDKLKSPKNFVRNALIDFFLEPKKRAVYFNVTKEEADRLMGMIEGKENSKKEKQDEGEKNKNFSYNL